MEHSAKDSEIFAMLTNNVNARARSLDGVFDAQRLSDTRTALSESSIIVDDDDGMRIDFTNAITMPFDFRKVSNVVWKNLRMKKLANMGMDVSDFVRQTCKPPNLVALIPKDPMLPAPCRPNSLSIQTI